MKRLTKAAALALEPGAEVWIDTLYNKTERARNKITRPTEVVRVKESVGCQTGALVTVQNVNGEECELDASWFSVV